MAITGGFGTLIDLVTGRPRRWYMRADGIRRWVSNDQPCDASNESDLWRCTECGRVGSVGRCCGDETRAPNTDLSVKAPPTSAHGNGHDRVPDRVCTCRWAGLRGLSLSRNH